MDQKSRINSSNSFLQVITALMPDSMVSWKFISKHPLQTYGIRTWHVHLQVSQIHNQNSSAVLWLQFLICQRQQRISQMSEWTKGNSRWIFGIFWCQYLFTSIPVPVALEVINRKFTQHITLTGTGTFSGQYLLHTQR